MLPLPNTLIADPVADLNWLAGLVNERLIDFEARGSSLLIREFEDELAYLSMDLNPSSGEDPTVRIEFGVQDSDKRVSTGVFVGRWNSQQSRFGELEMILLQGEHADVSPFVAALAGYLELPATAIEAD